MTKKTKDAAKIWESRWGFYRFIKEIQEEEALKMGKYFFLTEVYRLNYNDR